MKHLIILMIVFSIPAFAQNADSNDYHFSFRMGGGISLPLQSFNYSADFGFFYTAEVSYARDSNSISPTFLFAYHRLGVDTRSTIDISPTIQATNWKLAYFLIAPKLEAKFSTGAKIYWMPFAVGILAAESPTISDGPFKVNGASSTVAAFGQGVGFSVPIQGAGSRQMLDFGIRFLHSSPKFNNQTEFIDLLQCSVCLIFR
jgi:hypothetical protein